MTDSRSVASAPKGPNINNVITTRAPRDKNKVTGAFPDIMILTNSLLDLVQTCKHRQHFFAYEVRPR